MISKHKHLAIFNPIWFPFRGTKHRKPLVILPKGEACIVIHKTAKCRVFKEKRGIEGKVDILKAYNVVSSKYKLTIFISGSSNRLWICFSDNQLYDFSEHRFVGPFLVQTGDQPPKVYVYEAFNGFGSARKTTSCGSWIPESASLSFEGKTQSFKVLKLFDNRQKQS